MLGKLEFIFEKDFLQNSSFSVTRYLQGDNLKVELDMIQGIKDWCEVYLDQRN